MTRWAPLTLLGALIACGSDGQQQPTTGVAQQPLDACAGANYDEEYGYYYWDDGTVCDPNAYVVDVYADDDPIDICDIMTCYPDDWEPIEPVDEPPPDTGGGTTPEPLPTCENSEDIPADFQQQVNGRVDGCFTTNWSSLPFQTAQNTTTYSPGSGGWSYSIADWFTNNVTGCVIQNFDWYFYSGSVGSQVMQGLVNRLNTMASQQNLTPHQRMCSAMCVSSRLIKYSTENLSTVAPSSAVEKGAGVCREFAQIGERLLDGMGFSSWTVGSSAAQHAFVEVQSPDANPDGTYSRYYLEPQGGNCVFYNPH